jgi:hypothetical protein
MDESPAEISGGRRFSAARRSGKHVRRREERVRRQTFLPIAKTMGRGTMRRMVEGSFDLEEDPSTAMPGSMI